MGWSEREVLGKGEESEEEEKEGVRRGETASSTLTMLCQTNTQRYNGEILYIALICRPTCTHL